MTYITLEALGYVRCSARCVKDVPSEGIPSEIVLFDRFLPALKGIEVGDHVYVVAHFDRADPYQLTGSASTANEQGAFSIRSSSRPNRLGLTLARVTALDSPVVGIVPF